MKIRLSRILKVFCILVIIIICSELCHKELNINNSAKSSLLKAIHTENKNSELSYIKKSKKVERIHSFPILKFIDSKYIKYAVYYDDGITNYYSQNGKLILRTYVMGEKKLRYQTFDKDNNFYTYDNEQNLVEYSKGLDVYNSNNKLIYQSKKLPNKEAKYINSKKDVNIKKQFIKKLNNPRSRIYMSISTVLDKNFGKVSNEKMADILSDYFQKIEKSDPKLFQDWYDVFKYKKALTLNIGKIENRYVFAINSVHIHGIENTKTSLSETINVYNGKCAEVVLKTFVKHKLDGQYFYDIKLKQRHGNIRCYQSPPCTTCRANISLWTWKYPKFFEQEKIK